MRQWLTTAIEICGAASITIGVGLCFGLGISLIVGGILALVFSYLASSEESV